MIKSIKITSLLFAAAILFGATSCNKYEDGPSLSLRTKKARLVNTWELTEAVDGSTDITDFSKGITLTIEKDDSFSYGGETPQGAKAEGKGTWEFSDDKTVLILTIDGQVIPDKWTITRLKNDELWLKKTQSSGTEAIQKFKGLD
jgi:hypothetical protein